MQSGSRASDDEGSPSALRVRVRGIVQGVGFRPFVWQLAHRHGLTGWVRNTSEAVEISVEGGPAGLAAFVEGLRTEAPPRAVVEEVTASEAPPEGATDFVIVPSRAVPGGSQLVSADLATCPDCLRELFDPADRRYRHPFINCTNCGPRATIIDDVPYDRPSTTMAPFKMCPACQAEYEDPANRRFHAQPNACPACGPRVRLLDASGEPAGSSDPIVEAAALLRAGKIVAVKALGGYHLACDAASEEAVACLRERKVRPGKPFAVMFADVAKAREACVISPAEAESLESHRRPVVLVEARRESRVLAPAVSPGLAEIGAMLPATPLHHLLCREARRPLVMTSGNRSEEPICIDEAEALQRLGGIADFFLVHDRAVRSRYDDSVLRVDSGGEALVRRARSFAPEPVVLATDAPAILAVGAHLKQTFCLLRGAHAIISQHLGDLDTPAAMGNFTATLDLYEKLFRFSPEIVACDLHPDYASTRFAKGLGLPLIEVQHHHAHIAACAAEHGLADPVVGVSLDGTGYGPDATVWGGEILVSDPTGFRRAAHLRAVPLPGGDAAVRRPYRMALAYMREADPGSYEEAAARFFPEVDRSEVSVVARQCERGFLSPRTSSAGRLFDAVAALAGLGRVVSHEGEAAMLLEAAMDETAEGSYEVPIVAGDEGLVLDGVAAFAEAAGGLARGLSAATISARFHRGLALGLAEATRRVATEEGIRNVCLSGGCFQNATLTRLLSERLTAGGLSVFIPRQVPCNDGGIALGQAAVAAARVAGGGDGHPVS
ncbi:MAG: carbamoyltransferase HypF [Actinomycetota bacterium]